MNDDKLTTPVAVAIAGIGVSAIVGLVVLAVVQGETTAAIVALTSVLATAVSVLARRFGGGGPPPPPPLHDRRD